MGDNNMLDNLIEELQAVKIARDEYHVDKGIIHDYTAMILRKYDAIANPECVGVSTSTVNPVLYETPEDEVFRLQRQREMAKVYNIGKVDLSLFNLSEGSDE